MTAQGTSDILTLSCAVCGLDVHWTNATPVLTSQGTLAVCPGCLHPSPERP